MGLYTGELIFWGAYIRNGLSVSEMLGLYLGHRVQHRGLTRRKKRNADW